MNFLTDSFVSLGDFVKRVYRRIEDSICDPPFVKTQRELLLETVHVCRDRSLANPVGDPVAFFYWIARAWNRDLQGEAERLAAFCLLYILSLDLFDDVQDEDLAGKPHERAGPAIAVNSAGTLLFLALDNLRQAVRAESVGEGVLPYLEVFNRVSLLAATGQYEDLTSRDTMLTSEQVSRIQRAKTSSLTLVSECAAIYAGCDQQARDRYRRASEEMVLLIQMVDDLRDIFGKSVSPDLMAGRLTYPVACFYAVASPEQVATFQTMSASLPGSLKAIRKLLYESGAVQKVAEEIERSRIRVHEHLAATGNACAAHRNWLFVADGLAGAVYRPPLLACSRFIQQPDGHWYRRVQELTDQFAADLKPYGPPPVPPLIPWHQPQFMYEPQREVIFYPDVEGQPEQILPFYGDIMHMEDPQSIRAVYEAHLPSILAHELFHHWRDVSGRLTQDAWYEEWVAVLLQVAYLKEFHRELLADALVLADRILARNPDGISDKGREILESLFIPGLHPSRDAAGYGVDIKEAALIQTALSKRLHDEVIPLRQAVGQLL